MQFRKVLHSIVEFLTAWQKYVTEAENTFELNLSCRV